MRFIVLNRKVHYWISAVVALPVLVIICSGLLLQVKKQSAWIQPPEQNGTGTVPAVGFEEILLALQAEPDLGVSGWDDVDRLDVRPGRGIVKVLLFSGWEAQLDLGTGDVLQIAYRRSDLIESIHDGSFFAGDWSKLGVFLVAGISLLILWLSGIWMFLTPFPIRWRRKRAAASPSARQRTPMRPPSD